MTKVTVTMLAVFLIFSLAITTTKTKNIQQTNTRQGETQSTDAPQPNIPRLINYQGCLTDAANNLRNGNFDMVFEIYDAETGGNLFWQESQNVMVTKGLFNVLLGIINPIESIPLGPFCYLELTVAGEIITPRQRIVSTAYSYYAEDAAELGGIQASNYVVRPIQTGDIADDAVTMPKINQSGAINGQVIKWTGTAWAPRNDSIGGAGTGDNDWVRGTPDSVLYTIRHLGIARGGVNNMLYGNNRHTHVNLGNACTTGTSGQNYDYCTIGGGLNNKASNWYSTVSGGFGHTASGFQATVSGGSFNVASGRCATVGGGYVNTATGNWYPTIGGGALNTVSGDYATVAGGNENIASSWMATVGGGYGNASINNYTTVGGGWNNTVIGACGTIGGGRDNTADSIYCTVGGGSGNSASFFYATVSGGLSNTASGHSATVSGGSDNTASGVRATVGGGYRDTSAADYSFTVGYHSVVPSGYDNSAAFNGTAATASSQLRCGTLAKTGGSFTIDHPLEPNGKILNHYFVESPDMSNIYSGSTMIDANGRAEVRLPDYFDALNRNPRVQLTGVGSFEVFVAEDIQGNRFVIGGKPGCKVYWQVTGDRKDQSAEIIRAMMPVEQSKNGALAGRMLDDDFLAGCMKQLEEMGKSGEFHFRTARARQRYEDMKQLPLEIERMKRESKPVKD